MNNQANIPVWVQRLFIGLVCAGGVIAAYIVLVIAFLVVSWT